VTLETTLEKRGCAYLHEQGAHPIKRGQEGEPDQQVLWGRGHHFWIEFKKLGGKIRPGQKVWAKYLKAIGDEHYFVDTFEQLVEIVKMQTILYGRATARRDHAFNK